MSRLTYEIDAINADFFKPVSRDPTSQKSRWYKMIPCNCQICREKTDKHFYDYTKLLDGVFSKQATR